MTRSQLIIITVIGKWKYPNDEFISVLLFLIYKLRHKTWILSCLKFNVGFRQKNSNTNVYIYCDWGCQSGFDSRKLKRMFLFSWGRGTVSTAGTINLLGLSQRILIVKESSRSLLCPNQPRDDSLKIFLIFLKPNFHIFSSKNSRVEITLSPGMFCVKCRSNETAGWLGKTTSNCETSNSVTSVSYAASKTSYFLGKCQVSNIHMTSWVSNMLRHRVVTNSDHD